LNTTPKAQKVPKLGAIKPAVITLMCLPFSLILPIAAIISIKHPHTYTTCALAYLLIINGITFHAYNLDHDKPARKDTSDESDLWVLALLGGAPAADYYQKAFGHRRKTPRLSTTGIKGIWFAVGHVGTML